MKYCRLHDLAFCEKHEDQCLGDNCDLEEFAPARFCSVCNGVIAAKETRPLNAHRSRFATEVTDED